MSSRKFLPLILTLFVLVLVALVVFPQIANYEDVLRTIKMLKVSEIIFLATITVLNILIYVIPFMAATPGIRYWPSFMVRQTSFLISNGIPGGGTIGVAVQYAMIKDYKIPGPTATSGILLTSIWNMLVTLSLPGLATLLLLATGNFQNQNGVAATLGALAAVVSIATLILAIKYINIIKNFFIMLDKISLYAKSKIKFLPKLTTAESLSSFRNTTSKTVSRRWPSLIFTNLAQQFTQFIILYTAIEMLQPDAVSIFTALAAFAFARIGTFIPLTPGGLGTVDVILVSLLVDGGVSSEVALASTLIWRAATYFPQFLIGSITFLIWRVRSAN